MKLLKPQLERMVTDVVRNEAQPPKYESRQSKSRRYVRFMFDDDEEVGPSQVF